MSRIARWAATALLAGLLLVVMVLVTGAIGFCLFDDHESGGSDHHGMSLDLCAGLAVLAAATVVAVFADLEFTLVPPQHVVYAVSLHRLDPPPKSFP